MLRTTRTSLKKIINKERLGQLGGKRKMKSLQQEIEPIDEDAADNPKVKAMKKETINTLSTRELEANPFMPPKCK